MVGGGLPGKGDKCLALRSASLQEIGVCDKGV